VFDYISNYDSSSHCTLIYFSIFFLFIELFNQAFSFDSRYRILILNMNNNHNINNKPIKASSESTQGDQSELLSRTQVLTGPKQATTSAIATLAAITKRKHPRNRRLQRYWRKLRHQHVDEKTIQKYKKRLNQQRRQQQQQQQQQEQIQDVEMEESIPCNDTMETTNESDIREVCSFIEIIS
jgi:hypothetical protein